jgi:hypothetical protein
MEGFPTYEHCAQFQYAVVKDKAKGVVVCVAALTSDGGACKSDGDL